MLGVVTVTADDPADQLLREFGARSARSRRTRRRASACTSARRARRWRTRSSAARAPRGPAASPAGAAWSAARTTPRTRCRRTTSGSPSAPAPRSRPSARSSTSGRSARADGSDGYAVTTERTGAWLRRDRRVHTARGVVVAAGPLGTNKLLAHAKLSGSLPRISHRLGELVRTNSEAILAVTLPRARRDMTKRVAISSSVYPDPDTHIETVTYGAAGDCMSGMFTLLVGDGTRLTRPLKLIGALLRHPRPPRAAAPGRAAGRAARSSCSSCSRSTTRSRSARRRCARRRAAADRAGPGAPEPDVHPRRQPVRGLAGGADRRGRPERPHRGGGEHPHDGAHPRRRGDRREPRRRA